ncbi:MFS transporter [Azohydromonas aeria]|uniref:MFS transporter n=1 Tax=Azohydromonas aeria TaxID=2590212 RepID=UPI001E3F9AD7|nr:MFS transporter [Azohydromonas aeria]
MAADPSTEPRGDAAAPAVPGGRRAAMRFILIAVLIDMMSIGLIIPVLPALVGGFTGNATDAAFWFGVVSFTFGVANFFGSPILGALSDRFGRRPVLLLGFCGLAFSFFATALAPALWVLVAVRLVSGALQANAAVAQSYVADISTAQERAKRFGLLGATFGVGFILGPVTGGLLGDIDLRLPFYAAGTLALLNTLYGIFVLPESLPRAQRRRFEWRRANPVTALRELTALRGVGPLVVVLGLGSLAQFTLHSTWVLYTGLKFGWGPKENGWSLFAVGLMSALVQGGLMRQLLKRTTPQRLVQLGLVSSAVSYLCWGLSTEGWMMIAVIFLNILGFTVTASLQSLVSNAADATRQGTTMGSVASLSSLMAVLAPLTGAGLLTLVSHRPQGDFWMGLPFYFCALLQAIAAVVAYKHFRRQRGAAHAAHEAA